MLIRHGDLIFNTDQMVKVVYTQPSPTARLIIYLTDTGDRPSTGERDNVITLSDVDASQVWFALFRLTTPAAPE